MGLVIVCCEGCAVPRCWHELIAGAVRQHGARNQLVHRDDRQHVKPPQCAVNAYHCRDDQGWRLTASTLHRKSDVQVGVAVFEQHFRV